VKTGKLLWLVYVGVFFAALYTPIAILIGMSFNDSRTIARWEGFTTRWYFQVIDNQQFMSAFGTSVWIAILTTLLSIALGTLSGIAIARRSPGRYASFWDVLVLLPLIIPEIIEGVSISLFYRSVGIPNGVGATVIGHTVFSVSFVALIVRARMADVAKVYEEASMVLGANRWETFLRVLLPLAAPAIIAGAFLAFAASFDDVVKSTFTTDAYSQTLPIIVFAAARRGFSPALTALAALMVAVSLSAATARTLAQRRAGGYP
jgi:ABC-type spermidine/putrescine transport system permease subunit II